MYVASILSLAQRTSSNINNAGHHGGSELHASWVKRHIYMQCQRRTDTDQLSLKETDYLINDCMAFYRAKRRSKIDEAAFDVAGQKADNVHERMIPFVFHKHLTQNIYNKSFGKPLSQLFKGLRECANKPGSTEVLLTGGSFRNTHVSELTKKAIESAGLRKMRWLNDMAPANAE